MENQDAFDLYWLLVGEELTADEAMAQLKLTQSQTTKILRQLDLLGLIEWHTDKHIRKKKPRGIPVAWDSNNPVVRANTERWAARVVTDSFDAPNGSSILKLLLLQLTEEQAMELTRRLETTVAEFVSLSRKPGANTRLLLAVTPGNFFGTISENK